MAKGKRPNKAVCQRAHAKKRLAQRFDLQINRFQIRDLVAQIQQGKTRLLEKQSNRISVQLVIYSERKLAVVYDKERKTIVTFLPDQYLIDRNIIQGEANA